MIQRSLPFFLLLLGSSLFGQTRLIAYKSHSGHPALFSTALENRLFDIADGSLGAAPTRIIKTAQLDSVIFLSDTAAIMISSQYCKENDFYSNEKDLESIWKSGTDTVYHHPLFSRQHELNSIKTALKEEYHFRNNIDSVTFIGYDNQPAKKDRKKKNAAPPVMFPPGDNSQPPYDKRVLVLIGIIATSAAITGLLSRRLSGRTA